MVSRRAYLGCSQLLHRHIGRYRRSKHRKLLTASNTTRHFVVRLFPVGNGAMFMQNCRRKLGLTVRTMVTCQSGVSITNFKDVPCYELRPRGVMVRVLARDTKGRGFDSRPFHFQLTAPWASCSHTHMPLSPSSIICYRGQEAVMPCGWGGNRRSGVVLAMRRRH